MATFRARVPDWTQTTVKAKSDLGGNVEIPAETTGSDPILDVNGIPIDPLWRAEFRGFFWGEGCLFAGRLTKGIAAGQYRIMAVINLRSDDGETLVALQRRLGGTISLVHNISSRHTRWNVSAAVDCQRVARLLAGGVDIPFAKKKQLPAWAELVNIKVTAGLNTGSRYTPEQHERMGDLISEIKTMRNWVD